MGKNNRVATEKSKTGSKSSFVRSAIVTGAAHGLGLAIGRRFSVDGAKVLVVDCDRVVTSRVREKEFAEGKTFALVKDLSNPDAASVVFKEAVSTLGSINALINNAAWSFHKPMLEVTRSEIRPPGQH